MKMTMQIARAAAQDKGDASMRKAGRKTWTRADYNAACAEFERLWPHEVPSAS